MLAWTG